MKNTIENFKAGSISLHFYNWAKITSDRWILDIVRHGYSIEFESEPCVSTSFHQTSFSNKEKDIISNEIAKLVHMDVLRAVESRADQFLST